MRIQYLNSAFLAISLQMKEEIMLHYEDILMGKKKSLGGKGQVETGRYALFDICISEWPKRGPICAAL